FLGDLARFLPHVHSDQHTRTTRTSDLHALKSHAALAEDSDGVPNLYFRRIHRGEAVGKRLQARRLAVRNSVVHFRQSDFGQQSKLGEAAGQLKADNRAPPTVGKRQEYWAWLKVNAHTALRCCQIELFEFIG
ncbi:MAG: hypothetical protein VST68_09050, partial [Nitrospirota bacterium]|nr:hypothetical protein [Nitrospirota bacterium]